MSCSNKEVGCNKWPGDGLRLAMLMTHYRQPLDWTVDGLVEAKRRWKIGSTTSKALIRFKPRFPLS